jgi:uncharacterized protein YpmB
MSSSMKWRTVLVVAALASTFITVACKKQGGGTQALPASNEVAGWARTGEVRAFDASNLYQYIDGDAEKYVKAGVKNTSTADYKFNGKIEAVADIYTLSTADGAKTVYDSEPAGETKSVQLGDAARASGQSVVFRKGPHLVRLVAYQ